MHRFHDLSVPRGAISLAVRDYGGHGTPVVLLHGGTRNLGDWMHIAPALVAQHRVVALDFRSHGASTPCGGVWTCADAVADVAAVIRALQLDAPWLVGHSLGGLVATHYAAEGRACRGLINIDGVGVSVPPSFPSVDAAAARHQIQTMIAELAAALPPAAATPPVLLTPAERLEWLAAQQGAADAGSRATIERRFYRWPDGRYEANPSAAAQAALSQAVLQIDVFALTQAVRTPVLFIAAITPTAAVQRSDGSWDIMELWRRGVQETFATMRRTQPYVEWVGVPGSHMLVPDEAEALVPLLRTFLGRERVRAEP